MRISISNIWTISNMWAISMWSKWRWNHMWSNSISTRTRNARPTSISHSNINTISRFSKHRERKAA